MSRVFKYQIERTDEQELKLPHGFRMLSAQMQAGVLCIWALVDVARPLATVTIRIIGTGNPFIDHPACTYIDTVQDGAFVWHIFWK